MPFFLSVLVFLLFSLTPFAVGALLVPVLCRTTQSPVPRSFLVTHLVISLLTLPFVGFSASIWLFLPIFVLLTAGPAVLSAYAGSAFLFVLSNAFQEGITAGSLIRDGFHELNPFDVQEIVRESAKKFFTSLQDFFDGIDFTETFQSVRPPKGDSWESFFTGIGDEIFRNYNFSEAISNITTSESTKQYIDSINAAAVGLLENIEVSNFFNTTRIPPNLYASLDKVCEAFRNLAEHLNLSEMLREVAVPPDVQESFSNLGDALETLGQNFNVTELFEATSSPATEEMLKHFRDPTSAFSSFRQSKGSASALETIRAFFSSVPLDAHVAVGVYIFLLIVGIPCIFILRAALQEGSLFLITRRYESEIPSEHRSASGWMFIAATSGLASGASEVFPYCCFYLYLYSSQLLSAESVVVVIAHTLTAVPLRGVSQMRLAETSARRDVLKESKPGLTSGFVLLSLTNGIFNIWWLSFLVMIVISRLYLWLPGLFVVIDAIIVGVVIFWGRRICQRIIGDEQQLVKDRERKRD